MKEKPCPAPPHRRHRINVFIIGAALTMAFLPWKPSIGEEVAPPSPEPAWHIHGLVAALHDSDPGVRQLALTRLSELAVANHPYVQQHISTVRAILHNDDPVLLIAALKVLDASETDSGENLQAVEHLLRHPNVGVRVAAARTMVRVSSGSRTEQAIASVLEFITASDPETRADVMRGLGDMMRDLGEPGPVATSALQKIVAGLDDEEVPFVQGIAAESLAKIGPAAANLAISKLIHRAQSSKSLNVGVAAGIAITQMGEVGIRGVPALMGLLTELSSNPINFPFGFGTHGDLPTFGESLSQFREASEQLANELQRLCDPPKNPFKDPSTEIQTRALTILQSMGERASSALPTVLDLMKAKNADVRLAAVNAALRIEDIRHSNGASFGAILRDPDPKIRSAASIAFGQMNTDAAAVAIPRVVELLDDPDPALRATAANALQLHGPARVVPELITLLEHPDPSIRATALRAFNVKERSYAEEVTLALVELLDDGAVAETVDHWGRQQPIRSEVRFIAMEVLGQMGSMARGAIDQLIPLLRSDEKPEVIINAADALSKIGSMSPNVSTSLEPLLYHQEDGVKAAASRALAMLGGAPKESVPRLVDLVLDEDTDEDTRSAALHAIVSSVKHGTANADALLSMPVDEELFELIGKAKLSDQKIINMLVPLLKDQGHETRYLAAQTLGHIGTSARKSAPAVAQLLVDDAGDVNEGFNVREQAMATIRSMAPLELDGCAAILGYASFNQAWNPEIRLLAYEVGCADDSNESQVNVSDPIRWLAVRLNYRPRIPVSMSISERARLVTSLAAIWSAADQSVRLGLHEKLATLETDIADRVVELVKSIQAEGEHLPLPILYQWQKLVDNEYSMARQQDEIARAIRATEQHARLRYFYSVLIFGGVVHFGAWCILLALYTSSSTVRRVFFWNRWVRRLGGLGYVELAMSHIRPLRRYLFLPFRELLIGEAPMAVFDNQSYFTAISVTEKQTGTSLGISTAIPRLDDQVVIEGASGLGKTMLICQLLRKTKRISVFLPASRCGDGVSKAILGKLPGLGNELHYIMKLVRRGNIEVYIDGLNEVDVGIREAIRQFMEENPAGKVMVTTQPMRWVRPTRARWYTLEPLGEDEISAFLLSRSSALSSDATVTGEAFNLACHRFLQENLPQQSEGNAMSASSASLEEREVLRALSNPMDLTTVAYLLSIGRQPDLYALQEQQCQSMLEHYKSLFPGRTFPMLALSETVYRMRAEDRLALPEDDFQDEIQCMEECKIVIKRWRAEAGSLVAYREFRHDKIRDYFIVQTFLRPEHHERLEKHLADPRFRGIYVLLIQLMPLDIARTLRERVIQDAVDTSSFELMTVLVEAYNHRGAHERRRRGRRLDPRTEDALVELLEACSAIRDPSTLELVLARLPVEIQVRVSRGSTLRTHVTNIVKTCCSYPGGLILLRNAVQRFEGDTNMMSDLNALLTILEN